MISYLTLLIPLALVALASRVAVPRSSVPLVGTVTDVAGAAATVSVKAWVVVLEWASVALMVIG